MDRTQPRIGWGTRAKGASCRWLPRLLYVYRDEGGGCSAAREEEGRRCRQEASLSRQEASQASGELLSKAEQSTGD